jgi:hypothetical protein
MEGEEVVRVQAGNTGDCCEGEIHTTKEARVKTRPTVSPSANSVLSSLQLPACLTFALGTRLSTMSALTALPVPRTLSQTDTSVQSVFELQVMWAHCLHGALCYQVPVVHSCARTCT